MEGQNNFPPMPQPQPSGQSYYPDQPPPYPAGDSKPEFKEAYNNQGGPPAPYPYVQTDQPTHTPYVVHSAQYTSTISTIPPQADGVVTVSTVGFPDSPILAPCGRCHQLVTTRPEYVTGSFTWMMCCLICLFCPLFCWLIPFFMIGTKDVYHYCPNCHHLMGIKSRM